MNTADIHPLPLPITSKFTLLKSFLPSCFPLPLCFSKENLYHGGLHLSTWLSLDGFLPLTLSSQISNRTFPLVTCHAQKWKQNLCLLFLSYLPMAFHWGFFKDKSISLLLRICSEGQQHWNHLRTSCKEFKTCWMQCIFWTWLPSDDAGEWRDMVCKSLILNPSPSIAYLELSHHLLSTRFPQSKLYKESIFPVDICSGRGLGDLSITNPRLSKSMRVLKKIPAFHRTFNCVWGGWNTQVYWWSIKVPLHEVGLPSWMPFSWRKTRRAEQLGTTSHASLGPRSSQVFLPFLVGYSLWLFLTHRWSFPSSRCTPVACLSIVSLHSILPCSFFNPPCSLHSSVSQR